MCWLIDLWEGIPFACQLSASGQSAPCQVPSLTLLCWLGWRAPGSALQALPTAVLVRLSRQWGPFLPYKVPSYLYADGGMALCLAGSLEPPLSFSFQFLLGFLPLLHWCGGCFLAATCVICVSWSYLTGGRRDSLWNWNSCCCVFNFRISWKNQMVFKTLSV